MATPFVQGRLRKEAVSCSVETECAHCGQPIHLEVDGDLHCHVKEEGATPLIFVPIVNFQKLKGPSIIDDL